MTVYYNEIDKYAAQWLRNLINAGHIAPGIVDERSIEDVRPDDLDGFDQCHFFAGVGVWSYALRAAGWADNRSVWTASCPCQPYSQAGEGGGFDDERHLWPHFEHLLREQKRRPSVVLGEQVASSFAMPWVDLVHADLEALGYAFGCIPFPAAGVGAPHIRDRLYWVANADKIQRGRWSDNQLFADRTPTGWEQSYGESESNIEIVRLGSPSRTGLDQRVGITGIPGGQIAGSARQAVERAGFHPGGLADAASAGPLSGAYAGIHCGEKGDGAWDGELERHGAINRPGPTNGFWRDADWLGCTDGKWRPVEPGSFPLAHGATSRVGRLRAYGNAINAKAAEIFIRCVID